MERHKKRKAQGKRKKRRHDGSVRKNSCKHNKSCQLKSGSKEDSGKKGPSLHPSLLKELWTHLERPQKRPISIKELQEKMRLSKSEVRGVRRYLKSQVKQGKLVGLRRGRFLPKKGKDKTNKREVLITGIISVHPEGYGFVDQPGKRSLFIPKLALRGVLHGDQVLVSPAPRTWGKGAGEIRSILQPFEGRLIGTLFKKSGWLWFEPENERYPSMPVEGRLPKKQGDERFVIARVGREPTNLKKAFVKVEEYLDISEGAELDRLRAATALDIDRFPAEVLEEAMQVAVAPTEKEREGRLDLRDVALVTIDGEDARDFDDAVCLIQRPSGLQRLIVAVADVAHYVKEGTALNEEALRRGTSVYFPAHCTPMLPEDLSNGICSLRPNEERLCMVAVLDYKVHSHELASEDTVELVNTEFHEAVMCSQARLTYNQVSQWLEGSAEEDNPAGPFGEMLAQMNQLSKMLRKQRLQAGSLNLDLPEPHVILGEDGEIEDIVRRERLDAHMLIEEFMLQANQAVATLMLRKKIPAIYRVHEEPDLEKISNFMKMAQIYSVPMPGDLILPDVEELEDMEREKKDLWDIHPSLFNRILQAIKGDPAERFLNVLLLRSLKQANYTAECLGHFGLAMERYLHFTSPIRRYPDLSVHRMLKQYLRGELTSDNEEKETITEGLEEIAEHSSERERSAMEAEREVLARYKARYMEKHVGEFFEGMVSSVTSFGFFVELNSIFIEGLVHLRDLKGSFRYDEELLCLVNDYTGERYRPGDAVRIQVINASPQRGQIDFSLCQDLPQD